ncbi:MAG: hypothetical protein GTN62_05795 [Gemmatimonadales bacterium]|nr:hypothetical protein [Gemmatimonadales bacterium]NIN11012.1 hypothetical protein [Gemmatimonadales bacterium]NIN49609.1 hypothetical protein [Gemmatimonadales bacterium]NIP07073.1 hypothetical protein [Gemmatimonadales bacterium]NIQ99464.1 hypothetical protein [Gemmatimonadales bacterium]
MASADRARPRGRISFARVPCETPRYRSLYRPVELVSNAALAAWIYPCWRTARIRWTQSLDVLTRLAENTRRPLVFYSWHAYEPLTLCAFRDVPPELMPTGIGHDGLLSRMLQRATAWFGFRLWIYRRDSPIRPKQQIIDMVRARRCNIGLFADAGGPYGRVKPGLPEIARATDAWLVPLIVRGRPIIMLKRPWHYAFPLPFCRLTAYSGNPIDGRDATVDLCQDALDAVERQSTRLTVRTGN